MRGRHAAARRRGPAGEAGGRLGEAQEEARAASLADAGMRFSRHFEFWLRIQDEFWEYFSTGALNFRHVSNFYSVFHPVSL